MADRFIVLSRQQTAWIHSAVRQILKVTESYTCREQPMTEEDYSHVCDVFSRYTEKSRNNELVIRCVMAFTTYMDELEKKREGYPALNENQMRMLESAVDEMFDMAAGMPEETLSDAWQEEKSRKLDLCCEKFSDHELVRDLTGTFQDYFTFCMKERQQLLQEDLTKMTAEHKHVVMQSLRAGRNTIVVNAFAGAKAGKTASCYSLVADLREAGYAAEYVGGCVNELAAERKWETPYGTKEQQMEILRVQLERMDAKLGQVDFIVTDAPILLNQVYNQELSLEWQTMLRELNSHYFNYNFFLQREDVNLNKSSMEELEDFGKLIQKDIEIRAMLAVNGIQYSVYTQDMIPESLHELAALHKLMDWDKKEKQPEKNSVEEGGRDVFRKASGCHR